MAWRATVYFAYGTRAARLSLGVAAGVEMYHKEQRSAALEIQGRIWRVMSTWSISRVCFRGLRWGCREAFRRAWSWRFSV